MITNFKFQSDSINTNRRLRRATRQPFSLNSNLILLIQKPRGSIRMLMETFKFQSDSINTKVPELGMPEQVSLNSNLILLIPFDDIANRVKRNSFKFQSDSINTFLRIRSSAK